MVRSKKDLQRKLDGGGGGEGGAAGGVGPVAGGRREVLEKTESCWVQGRKHTLKKKVREHDELRGPLTESLLE